MPHCRSTNTINRTSKFLAACTGLLLAAACSQGPIAVDRELPSPGPLTPAHLNICMADEADEHPTLVSGWKDGDLFNCTANDVSIANARTTSGEPIECAQDEEITVDIVADIEQTSTSERLDIGIWIGEGGATDAQRGTCAFFYLPGPFPNGAITDEDGDECGDLVSAAVVTGFDLASLDLICDDPDGDGFIEIPSCVSWTQPGGDRECPDDAGGDFAGGTLPANKSKCNCEPFLVPIVINPSLEVQKICDPSDDDGLFDLRIDGVVEGDDTACGGTTGPVEVSVGSHTVSEVAGTGTDLGDYFAPVIGGDCAADGTIDLASGEAGVCTITNTRRPTIEVQKILIPATDPGLFDLEIDGVAEATDVGDGGTTGAVEVTEGEHTVSESAGTGTDLSDYDTVIGGDCAADGTVTVAAGDNAVCTITNTRIPTIEVEKICDPTDDTGLFDLEIDSVVEGDDTACGGTTGPVDVTIGEHTVSESAGTGTDLSQYDAVIGGDCAADGTVTVAAGDNALCTITNTRRATVTVNKREAGALPLTIAWQFEIRVGADLVDPGTVVASGTADLTTGVVEFSCTGAEPTLCTNVGGIAQIVPGDYQFCEVNMPAGWSNNIAGFTPDALPAEGADNGNECVDITLAAGDSGVPTGVPDPIDNTPPPGGDARTIGFWKTHSCEAPGNQEDFLSPLLPQTLGSVEISDCSDAVLILNKKDLDGVRRASDACYALAAQLLAAELNVEAGAGTCAAATTAINDANTLLTNVGFDGTGACLPPKSNGNRTTALNLAATLDSYNNNTLCP